MITRGIITAVYTKVEELKNDFLYKKDKKGNIFTEVTDGIPETIFASDEVNIYDVRLPVFESTGQQQPFVLSCRACLPGGLYNGYKVDDLVYVGFVDNIYNNPIILGKIDTLTTKITNDDTTTNLGITKEDKARLYLNIDSLSVKNETKLSKNSKIGDISYNDLDEALTTVMLLKKYQDKLFVDVEKDGNKLVFKRLDGSTKEITL